MTRKTMTRGEQHEKRDEQLHTTILSAAEIDYTEHTEDKELTTALGSTPAFAATIP